MQELIRLEKEALESVNRKDYEHAVELLKRIVMIQPDYEHGFPHYDLACCLEELARFDEAHDSFVRALESNPSDPNFCGGYASFLYQHGTAHEAFDAYVHFIVVVGPQSELGRKARLAIMTLGKKLGLTAKEVEKKIREMEEEKETFFARASPSTSC